jgi:lipid-binding SYLF domain-containing protein
MSITRRNLVHSAGLAATFGVLASRSAVAASDAAEIDRDATAALGHLYRIDRDATKLRDKARAVLIFPRVVKAGFIFGGQGGKGVLREGGRSVRYYTIAAASFGLQAGAQYFSYAMFFLDPAALSYLNQSDGWAVGTDPNVVVLDKGAAASITSTTLAKKVVAIPFGQEGLMAGLDLQGSKITTYNPNS